MIEKTRDCSTCRHRCGTCAMTPEAIAQGVTVEEVRELGRKSRCWSAKASIWRTDDWEPNACARWGGAALRERPSQSSVEAAFCVEWTP